MPIQVELDFGFYAVFLFLDFDNYPLDAEKCLAAMANMAGCIRNPHDISTLGVSKRHRAAYKSSETDGAGRGPMMAS